MKVSISGEAKKLSFNLAPSLCAQKYSKFEMVKPASFG